MDRFTQQEQQKANFNADYALRLQPEKNTRKDYGFVLKLYNGKAEKKYHGKFFMIYLGLINNRQHVLFHQDTIYINNHAPDKQIELLANEIREILNPIQFSLNPDGTLHNVENLNEIKKRFNQEKERLQKYYKGTLAQKILQQTQTIIHKPVAFVNHYKENPVCNLFFLPFYQKYTANLSHKSTLTNYPIQQPIQTLFLPQEHQTNTGKTLIRITGSYKAIETTQDYLDVKNTSFNSLEYKVKLHAHTNLLFSIEGKLTHEKEQLYVGIFEQKSQAAKNTNQQNNRSQFFVDEVTHRKEPPKKAKINVEEIGSPLAKIGPVTADKNIYQVYKGKAYTQEEWEKFREALPWWERWF